MKRFIYTRHVKNRMRWRQITESEIELTVNEPDFTEPSEEGGFHSWKEFSGKYLRVTYQPEGDWFTIITAVKKKKGWR